MTEVLTAERALKLLESVVEDFGPDTTYDELFPDHRPGRWGDDPSSWSIPTGVCRYFEEGAGGAQGACCIVGQVVARAGIDTELFVRYNHGANSSDYRDVLTAEAGDVLAVAQQRQDGGSTWGDALARAQEYYAELYA